MRVVRAGGSTIKAFCLMLVLALALAPAVEALHHGPSLTGAEAHPHDHDHGHHHADGHHDGSDHDHVSVAVLIGDSADLPPLPARRDLAGAVQADDSPPDSPRRPPRPMTL